MATSPHDTTGRENVPVSNLPPPLPPAPAPRSNADSSDEWDWDRAKELAEQWFRPLADRDGWLALAYLAAGAAIAPFLFGAMVAASAVTFGLLFRPGRLLPRPAGVRAGEGVRSDRAGDRQDRRSRDRAPASHEFWSGRRSVSRSRRSRIPSGGAT